MKRSNRFKLSIEEALYLVVGSVPSGTSVASL